MQAEVGRPPDSAIREAGRVCARVWPDRRTASEQARLLRRRDLATALVDRPAADGTVVLAEVWHPAVGVIGSIRYRRGDG